MFIQQNENIIDIQLQYYMFIGCDVSVSLPLRKIDNTTSNYHEVDWDFDANLVSLCIYGPFFI